MVKLVKEEENMGLKSDSWIEEMVKKYKMIEPYEPGSAQDRIISYGLSSYGYDVRLADEFLLPISSVSEVIDPKNFNLKLFTRVKAKACILPPHSFCLASSLEYFRIPRKIMGLCVGKSTYARCGITVNITPLEPEWEGNLTIQISNAGPMPVKIYPNEGIAQVLFFEADTPCKLSYRDKKGKYQAQKGITLPKL